MYLNYIHIRLIFNSARSQKAGSIHRLCHFMINEEFTFGKIVFKEFCTEKKTKKKKTTK